MCCAVADAKLNMLSTEAPAPFRACSGVLARLHVVGRLALLTGNPGAPCRPQGLLGIRDLGTLIPYPAHLADLGVAARAQPPRQLQADLDFVGRLHRRCRQRLPPPENFCSASLHS